MTLCILSRTMLARISKCSSILQKLSHVPVGLNPIVCATSRNTSTYPNKQHISQNRSLSSSVDQSSERPDLFTFLTNEIEMESAAWHDREQGKPLPNVTGFEYSFDGAVVTLFRQINKTVPEKIKVKFNVSGSVDSGSGNEDEIDSALADDASAAHGGTDLCSRPEFTIDIQRGDRTLSFLCSFINPNELSQSGAISDEDFEVNKDQQANDERGESSDHKVTQAAGQPVEDFQINEFALYDSSLPESEQNKVYAADCSVIDGELYDHLLEFLEERGIDDGFAGQLVRLANLHEHNCYIKLLKNIKEFVATRQ